MPVFILAGLALQYFIGKRVYELAISKGMSFVVLLLTLDVTLSVFFGDRSFKENNGYSHYFEKSVIWFLVGYVSLVLMQNRNKSIILVLTFFIFVERIAGYGVMFNAATGMILYLILLMFCLMFTFNKIHLVIMPFQNQTIIKMSDLKPIQLQLLNFLNINPVVYSGLDQFFFSESNLGET